MKASDEDKLKNEYQKLVEGLREIDDGREEDSFMANPGSHYRSIEKLYCGLTRGSAARRSIKGSCAWKYQKSRTFRGFLEAVR